MFLTLMAVVAVIGLAAAFMGTVDQTGLVTIEPAKGTAEGRAAIEAVIVPTPAQFSFGALTRASLDALDSAAVVAVDVTNRKVYFTDDDTKGSAILTAAKESNNAAAVLLVPDSGQSGRSLTWTAVNGELGQVGNSFLTAVQGLVSAAKPRISVESLVTKLVGVQDENGGALTPSLVVVDQRTGAVWAIQQDNGGLAAIAALTLNAGNSGQLTLSEPSADPATSPLVFEGGEIVGG